MKKRRVWPWVVLVVVVLIIGGGLFAKRKAGQGQALDPTLLAKASRGDLEIAVTELGKIEPREKVGVKSKVAGQVEKILV